MLPGTCGFFKHILLNLFFFFYVERTFDTNFANFGIKVGLQTFLFKSYRVINLNLSICWQKINLFHTYRFNTFAKFNYF